MKNASDQRDNEAAIWLARTRDSDFLDWDTFTAWLEADPGNADAYQRLSMAAEDLELAVEQALVSPTTRTTINPIPLGRRRQVGRWALAASIAGAGILGLALVPQIRGEVYRTAPGEMRTVRIAASDTLVLNGSTTVRVAQFAGRRITLEEGQLLLRLDGNGSPVTLRSGDLSMVDVGTTFEVARQGTATRVSVGEGAVMIEPSTARVTVRAGQQVDTTDDARTIKVEEHQTALPGSWQTGQLVYAGESLDRVADDLRRATGVDFFVVPGMRQREFSGTLSVADIRRDPAMLGPLLGASVTRTGARWTVGKG